MNHLSEIKNVFFAFVLALIVLIGWQFFFSQPEENQKKQTKTEAAQPKDSESELKNEAKENFLKEGPQIDEEKTSKENISLKNEEKETKIQIENDKISGVFSSKGLSFQEITLKDYKKSLESEEKFKLFEKDCQLVFYSDFGFIPNFQDDDENFSSKKKQVEFPNQNTVWKSQNSKIGKDETAVLTWKNSEGVEFETRISLDANYLFKIERKVKNNSNSQINFSFYGRILKNFSGGKAQTSPVFEGFISFWNNGIIKNDYEKIFKKNTLIYPGQEASKNDEFHWAGFSDKYWLTSLISNEDQNSVLSVRTKMSNDSQNFVNKAQIESVFNTKLLPGKEISRTEYLFVGAKELNILDQYQKEKNIKMFDRSVDFGVLYFLTKPIFILLQYFNKLLGNFGLAIMLLTVVIKTLLFPLARKSVISANKMKELNPEIERIKAIYKDDKQRQNLEILNIFKKNKISPLSPLLPILMQLPIFFALYKVLSISIEMRHAPFFGWIKDLSARDSINIFNLIDFGNFGLGNYLNIGILSVILGLTMFLQQKFQPAPTDPNQKTVMRWIPWIFIIISASFPAGLILYWGWNNLVSIAQQIFIEKFFIKKNK
jgi:YidC/Oxa1 family membrane protein insertase